MAIDYTFVLLDRMAMAYHVDISFVFYAIT